MSSYDLDAFSSPNFPPLVNGQWHLTPLALKDLFLALVGIDIVVNWNQVIRPKGQKKFRAHKGENTLFVAQFL